MKTLLERFRDDPTHEALVMEFLKEHATEWADPVYVPHDVFCVLSLAALIGMEAVALARCKETGKLVS